MSVRRPRRWSPLADGVALEEQRLRECHPLDLYYADMLDDLGLLTRLDGDALAILAGLVVTFWVESRVLDDGGLAPAEIMRLQRRRMQAADLARGR